MDDDKLKEEIIDKLDKILRVIAITSTKTLNMTERIVVLDQCGLKPKEIADILGTTSNVVSVTLSKLKKKRGKNGA